MSRDERINDDPVDPNIAEFRQIVARHISRINQRSVREEDDPDSLSLF